MYKTLNKPNLVSWIEQMNNFSSTTCPTNISDIANDVTCYYVNEISNIADQCDFVRTNGTCTYEGVFYSYTELTYCQLGHLRPVALVLLIAILVILFFAMASVADDFFCPSLTVISKTLHLPDHIAGVTLLAFGNGANDIFSSISGINQSKPHLVFSSLYGSGIFITTVVTGAVLITGDFSIKRRPIIRDLIFYIATAVLIWAFIYNGVLRLVHSLILIGFYVLYIITVIIGHYLNAKQSGDKDETHYDFESEKPNEILNSKLSVIEFDANSIRSSSNSDKNDEPSNNNNSETEQKLETEMSFTEEFKQFLLTISPINIEDWKENAWYNRVLDLLKSVPYFIMLVCIPVVDLEKDQQNWNRLLACTNTLLTPQAILFLFQINASIYGKFPLWLLLLIISCVLCIVIWCTSKAQSPPMYHRVFGFVGFVMSAIFTNSIAQEIICVLTTLGIVFSLSESILGLTVLAWGNSLGDLITDYTMARNGYPGIAIAACFGGTIFNLLMGIGLPYGILFIGRSTSSVIIQYSSMITLLFVTIMVSLCATLATLVLTRFNSTKMHAFILFAIYVSYLVIALLTEFKVILN